MLLTTELVEKFQTLHLTKNGIELSYLAAEFQLRELAELIRLTSKPEVAQDA